MLIDTAILSIARRFCMAIKRIGIIMSLCVLLGILFASCATTSRSKDMNMKDDGMMTEKDMSSDKGMDMKDNGMMKKDDMSSDKSMDMKDDGMMKKDDMSSDKSMDMKDDGMMKKDDMKKKS